ncbi:MAG: insulinase family protein, partial [Candidatus Omnitrophica bacterium]|nr:insulinase family protein [Candidatus Omnitrophota bacterium]
MKKICLTATFLFLSTLILFQIPSLLLASEIIYDPSNTLKATLRNGLTVVIHELHKTPVVSIEILVKTGSATEGAFLGSGISHLLEHMLFKGKGQEYCEKIKGLGGFINGFTSHEYTGYTITVPSGSVNEGLVILRDFIIKFSCDDNDLKNEKEVILDEIRKNVDDPSRYAMDRSWDLVFKNHPYKYPIIGYEELFLRLAKDDVEKYYATRYTPNNMILSVAGDVSKDILMDRIRPMYGELKRNFIEPTPDVKEGGQFGKRAYIEKRNISSANVVMAYRSVDLESEFLYPLDVLAVALGTGDSSILKKEVRDKERLVHTIACYNYTLKHYGVFFIYFTADHENIDKAIASITEKISQIAKNGLSASEIEKSVQLTKANFIYAIETADGRVRDMATSEVVADDYRFSQNYVKGISEVSDESIKRAAGIYLAEDGLNTVTLLPEASPLTNESSPQERAETRDVEIVKLDNGATLLISEDHSVPICSMAAVFLGGVRAEDASNNGITYLTSRLLLGGTDKMCEEELKYAIESKGGSIDTISGNNSFGVTLELLSKDAIFGIDTLGDIVKYSVFKEEVLEKERSLALAAIKRRDDDITARGLMKFREAFFKGHPYQFHPLGNADTMRNISRSNIVSYYKALCVPKNMVLAVSGDVLQDDIIRAVKECLKDFIGGDPNLPHPQPLYPKGNGKEIVSSMKREQSLVIIGFPSVSVSSEDRYDFEIIDTLMSGISG